MEAIQNLLNGFIVALQPINIILGFIGVFLGNLIGILPGLGPTVAMVLLLPFTYTVDPTAALIMLAGIYYGSMYGGTITSILLKIPGDSSSLLATLDGYEMARKGKAGPALVLQAVASFVGGMLTVLVVAFLSTPAAEVGLKFGPPEYTILMLLSLLIISTLSSGSLLKSMIMAFLGLFLSFVGVDIITGQQRFTFGSLHLYEGIDILPIILGFFALSEIFIIIENKTNTSGIKFKPNKDNMHPSKEEWKESIAPTLRGSAVGAALGLIPGGGALVSTFASYGIEKKLSKKPENFGKGEIAGLVGPEAANNAGSTSAFIPLLSLGLPTNAITAILLGALIVHGISPGPLLAVNQPELFWGVIASMFIGNVLLLILNIPLISIWLKVLQVPMHILTPLIIILCVAGAYVSKFSIFDIWMMFLFGIMGYFLKKSNFEFSPLILAFVLGPILDESFRQSLLMSQGNFLIFVDRKYSLMLVVIGTIFICWIIFNMLRKQFLRKRKGINV